MIHDINRFYQKQSEFLTYANGNSIARICDIDLVNRVHAWFIKNVAYHLASPFFACSLGVNGLVSGMTLFIENGIGGVLTFDKRQIFVAGHHFGQAVIRSLVFSTLGIIGVLVPLKSLSLAASFHFCLKKYRITIHKTKSPLEYGKLAQVVMRIIRGFTCCMRDLAYVQSIIFVNVDHVSEENRNRNGWGGGTTIKSIIKPLAGIVGAFSESLKNKIEISWFSFWTSTYYDLGKTQWQEIYKKNPEKAFTQINIASAPVAHEALLAKNKPIHCDPKIKEQWLLEHSSKHLSN